MEDAAVAEILHLDGGVDPGDGVELDHFPRDAGRSDGQWLADLTPLAGPVLGPFAARSDALTAEAAWITEHWLFTQRG